MTKKWLYSVAIGALLMAGEALGITVHDVLSNGFWSAEQRGTEKYLQQIVPHPEYTEKTLKFKYKEDENGNITMSWTSVSAGPKVNHTRWKKRWHVDQVRTEKNIFRKEKSQLIAKRDRMYKEKTTTIKDDGYSLTYDSEDNILDTYTYTVKPLGLDVRPMGSFVVDDWFPDSLTRPTTSAQFYGTEHNAVTNVISDNEAYITGTISQTGHIDEYFDKKMDEPASLLRTYTQHITTDEDHVYVEQEITENTQNDPIYNRQTTYQTQYTATYKKGRWKGSTETISQMQNAQLADWYIKYMQDRSSSVAGVTKILSRSAQRTKDTQNSR